MRTSWARKGFSLVELLTVIAIIALIISIVLPALSGARNAGRKVSTQGLLNDISGAAGLYKGAHQGRNPGYFSAREMGDAQNAARGMSEMENVMLDLAGEAAIVAAAGPSTVAVGPTAAQEIIVDPSLIGAEGSYFKPSGEFYVAQLASSGQQISNVAGHAGSSETDIQLLDMVDAFGQPLLFWNANDTLSAVTTQDEFARRQTSDGPALFYWTSNAAFLQATNLGRRGYDMTLTPVSGTRASLIGSGAMGTPGVAETMLSMQALLGSPSAPKAPAGQTVEDLLNAPGAGSIEALFPGRAKGAFVIQSAGSDGVYLSSNDRGFRTVAHEPDHIDFGLDFFVSPTARVTDDDGKPTSRDVVSEFDDIVVSGGG